MMAERVLRAAKVVPRESLIYDQDSGCRGAVGGRKVASGNQGDTKRLQIIVTDPGKLNISLRLAWPLTGNRYIASDVIVLELGIVGSPRATHAGKAASASSARCSTGTI